MTQRRTGARFPVGSRAYLVAFTIYLSGSVLWLALGLIPSLVPSVPALRHGLESVAQGDGGLAGAAHRLMMHGPFYAHGPRVALEYLFSLLNVALGVLLMVKRPHDLVPRLLAVAFIGTAATFNAPSHELFHAIGTVPVITGLHFAFHIMSGVAYLWAVMLFPDGRLPLAGRSADRGKVAVAATISTAAIAYICYLSSFIAHPPFFVVFFGIMTPVIGMIAQDPRLRGTDLPPAARQQSRVLRRALVPALVVAVVWLTARLAAFAIPGAGGGRAVAAVAEMAFPAVFAVVPVTLFVAILRYRLWDIDLVMSRAFAYALLAGFIALVYVAALGATGWLFRAEGWSAVVAMAVVAVAVQPVRERLHALANQLVFGQRLSPREAMRTLAVRLDQAASADELSELTAVVVAGTRCSAAEMWLIMGDHLLLAAAAPAATPAQPVATRRTRPLAAATLGACHAVTGADLCVPVTHEGQLLAVLALRLPAGVALPKAESRLIGELAGHAGLLVANARLTESLARQVEVVTARTAELRRSRLQVVAAQDDERRRLERDIHDGAQQELVALLIHIRALRRRPADHDPTETFAPLRQAVADTRATLAHLCTGSPPAVLTAGGLAAALAAAAAPVRRAGLDVELVDTLHRRLSADIESALYFCALEAMQNASKHARASRVTVRLEFHDDDVVLSVADDGAGFDPARSPAGSGLSNMVDRLAVLGGSAWIESAPDAGVRLSCRVPLAPARAGAVG